MQRGDESRNEGLYQILLQQMAIEKHVSSSITVSCGPLSRSRTVFATGIPVSCDIYIYMHEIAFIYVKPFLEMLKS